MDLAAIFLLLIVLVLIVFFVSFPFFDRKRIRVVKNNRELSFLLAERERLLTALQELEFDQSLGKIPAEDYPLQRSDLLHKGADVLRKLDSLSYSQSHKPDRNINQPVIRPNVKNPLSDEEMEALLSQRRAARKEKTAGFCPTCGKPVLQSDVFCPSCGNTLRKQG
jgi:hypothetical protein